MINKSLKEEDVQPGSTKIINLYFKYILNNLHLIFAFSVLKNARRLIFNEK